MTRKNFIRMCGLLGIGLPVQTAFSSCNKETLKPLEKVVIIGAGAAGLTAAYLLNQQGVNVQVLEATSIYGGRMKRSLDFADFPIPLGAEWLHIERGIFDEIVNDSSIQVNIDTTPYDPDIDYGLYEGNQISIQDLGVKDDQKFINSTWFDFFEQYLIPPIAEVISFNQPVEAIDYKSDKVIIKTINEDITADKIIITVPVKILQNGAINFIPELPSRKKDAINNVTVWDGCKAFIEFSDKFYPAFTEFEVSPENDGQKLYYDAAYGQNTSQNILGFFAVGVATLPYINLSNDELKNYILAELDEVFSGQASLNYVKHIFQNWNEEPYADGAYVYDQEDSDRIQTLGESIDNKLFFAGDAYTTGNDWGSIHAAARSAIRAVKELTG